MIDGVRDIQGLPSHLVAQMIRYRLANYAVSQIAGHFGISESTTYKYLEDVKPVHVDESRLSLDWFPTFEEMKAKDRAVQAAEEQKKQQQNNERTPRSVPPSNGEEVIVMGVPLKYEQWVMRVRAE